MASSPTAAELTECVVRILATELKVSEGRVRNARSLKVDVGMDSISAANAAFEIEDVFGVEIELGENDSFDSVEAIVGLVRRAIEVA